MLIQGKPCPLYASTHANSNRWIAILGILAYAIVVHPFVVYLVDRKGLRKFSSPQYAAISSIWRMLHSVRERHFLAVHDAHQQLGSHVRIGPNHISICAPQAMNEIYGHGANFQKDTFYDSGAGAHRNINDTRSREEHNAKRKVLAHAFAQRTLTDLEPTIMATVQNLVDQIGRFASEGKLINLRRYLNYFTIDLLAGVLYGEPLGCLDRGNDLVTAETPGGKKYIVPYVQTEHRMAWTNVALGMEPAFHSLSRSLLFWHKGIKASTDWENVVYHVTEKRHRVPKSEAKPDIFSRFLQNSKGEPLNVPRGEIRAECSNMMVAGTDTTAASLTYAVWLLYKHPKILAKLRDELDSAWGPAAKIPTYNDVSGLPFLRACVDEAIRVMPSSTIGMPRIVPKGGRIIAGQFINEGVTVSVPTYSLLRNPSAFERPEEFDPDRWLRATAEQKVQMAQSFFPFSHGPRACLGRNISNFEQLVVTAAIVKNFDLQFPDESYVLPVLEHSNANPGEMWLSARWRTVPSVQEGF
ncbi:cytochrome P450 [Aspergillus varians]